MHVLRWTVIRTKVANLTEFEPKMFTPLGLLLGTKPKCQKSKLIRAICRGSNYPLERFGQRDPLLLALKVMRHLGGSSCVSHLGLSLLVSCDD